MHLIQVELQDGQWVSFGEQLPEEMTAWPLRVVLALNLVLIIPWDFVALTSRPLDHSSHFAYLAESALALGQDLQRPPLEVEEDPKRCAETLRAFNAMQASNTPVC